MFCNFVNFENLKNKINEYVSNKKIITLDPYNVSPEKYNSLYCTEIQEQKFTGCTINYLRNIDFKNNDNKSNNLTNELLSEMKIDGNYDNDSTHMDQLLKKYLKQMA